MKLNETHPTSERCRVPWMVAMYEERIFRHRSADPQARQAGTLDAHRLPSPGQPHLSVLVPRHSTCSLAASSTTRPSPRRARDVRRAGGRPSRPAAVIWTPWLPENSAARRLVQVGHHCAACEMHDKRCNVYDVGRSFGEPEPASERGRGQRGSAVAASRSRRRARPWNPDPPRPPLRVPLTCAFDPGPSNDVGAGVENTRFNHQSRQKNLRK